MTEDIFNPLLLSLLGDREVRDGVKIVPITQAGSNRQYFRIIVGMETYIGVVGTSREENHAFVSLARHFAERGLNVPKVLAVSDDETVYIQEDLGTQSLYDAISDGRGHSGDYSEEEIKLLEGTIAALPRFQTEGGKGLDYSVCYPQPEFDKRNIMFDLNYFKYCFLKQSGVDFHELRLEDDFEAFAEDLLRDSGPWGFMIRDFQARNVMLRDGTPYYIDFQGGRHGPMLYDVASFLWQASARFSPQLRERLFNVYAENCPDRKLQWKDLRLLVLFRTLQVLGAYGYRGLYERKKHFIDSIPPAIENLKSLLDVAEKYPHLHETLTKLVKVHTPHLTVRVFSFSYKKGIPEDKSGNGGGYVFDCRATNNPGRYEQYKKLTGLDQPVIDFLEADGEILAFLDSVYKLADAHVARYIERGFTNLMFSFGCTGGQHRSVYSAQHLAEHIHEKYGVEVILVHREQNIEKHYKQEDK